MSVLDSNNKEIVVMGKGIGFKRCSGEILDESKIEKIFRLEDQASTERLKTLVQEIPLEFMIISDKIINHAQQKLGKKLNEVIYITLTDHLYFAVERNRKGFDIKNGLLWEIKRLYKGEFQVGKEALEIIKNSIGIELPEDEAGYIALHIVNGELNDEMPNIVNMTKLIQEVLNIVKYYFKINFDEESLTYYRFVTHLKFFAQRVFHEANLEHDEDYLFETVMNQEPKAYECTELIRDYMVDKYQHDLSKSEMLFLTIHIARLQKASK